MMVRASEPPMNERRSWPFFFHMVVFMLSPPNGIVCGGVMY
jgi:hypothetical protein